MVALVVFGGNARTLSSFASAYDTVLVRAVQGLPDAIGKAGDGTNLTAGIRAANDLLAGALAGFSAGPGC